MAEPTDVTVYKKPNISLVVIDGDAPDTAALEAQVAQLTADLAAMTAQRDALQVQINAAIAAAEADKAADAAHTSGQAVLDVLKPAP